MNNINEIIIPNIPELSFSINHLDINSEAKTLRGRHFHKEFEIFRIVEGSMLICSDDVVQEVSAGDIIFINSYYIHEIKPISKYCKATYFQIDLQPYIEGFFNIEDDFLHHFISVQHSNKIRIFSSDKICDIIEQIENELYKREEFYDMQIKAYIYQIIVFLLRFNFISHSNKFETKSVDRILPAINYINDNIDKKILLDELCGLMHIDKYYFCKLFKQTIGATFTEYVNFARLYKARQLLINHKLSISEIALSCGFSSTQYFNKIFKKQYGFSPSHYKKLFTTKAKD